MPAGVRRRFDRRRVDDRRVPRGLRRRVDDRGFPFAMTGMACRLRHRGGEHQRQQQQEERRRRRVAHVPGRRHCLSIGACFLDDALGLRKLQEEEVYISRWLNLIAA